MSSSSGGISASQVSSIARSIAREEANAVRRELNSRINEIMRDIDQMSRELQRSIETQTAAIIAGVAATTTAVVSTKSEISSTREQLSNNLTLQLKSELQLELGRKLNVARSASTKFKQFYQDIRSRFDKSVQGVFINRNEYDARFGQIFEEYENKIRTIGEHIFQIRDEIRLVEAASSESLENIHSLPMEVDLYRLQLRSEELDQTVELLEASRLQEIKTSLEKLQEATNRLNFANLDSEASLQIGIETQFIASDSGNTDLLLGAKAEREPGGSVLLNTELLNDASSCLNQNLDKDIESALRTLPTRSLNAEEYEELQKAIDTLNEDGIISPDDAAFAQAVINSQNINTYA